MIKAQQFWDRHAAIYDESEKEFEAHYHDIIAQTKVYLKSEDHVLDFGCATGTKTFLLAEGVKQIIGLDYSSEMIAEAKRKKEAAQVENITFTQGTIFNYDLEEASFDAVIAYAVVHLLEDPGKSVQRIYQLLKPGGCFISVTPCFKNKASFKTGWQVLSYRLKKVFGTGPLHLNRFSVKAFEKLINKHKFTILKSEKRLIGMTVAFVVAGKC